MTITSKIRESLPFLLVLAGGLALRLLSLQGKNFWFDEAWSWSLARQPLHLLFTAVASDNNPPFYYLLLHYWLKISENETFLRLPSLIFGLLGIYLAYQIAKELFDKKTGLIAAMLFSFSPLNVYYSTEARMYSLWTFLTLIVFYYFLKILKNPSFFNYLLFTIYYLLSLYTHYFTVFFVFALDLFLLLLGKKKYRQPLFVSLLGQGVIFFLSLPWLALFLTNPHAKPWGPPNQILGIPATFLSFALGGMGNVTLKTFFLNSTPFPSKFIFALLFIFLSLFFLYGLTRREKKEARLVLFLIIFLPIFLTAILSLYQPFYSPRAFLAFSFAFYLLVAFGLGKITKTLKSWLVWLILVFLVLANLIQNYYPPFKPQTLRQAVEFIQANSGNNPIVHTDILTFYSFLYYFRGEEKKQFLIFPSALTRQTTDLVGGTPTPFSLVASQNQAFWSVAYTWDEKTWEFKKAQESLKKDFKFTLVKNINDLEIFSYQPF